MKRAISFLLVMALMLSLSACGKSEDVKNVEAMIRGIGEISMETAEEIYAAKNAYDALSAEDQKNVDNYGDLEKALDKLHKEEGMAKAEALYNLLVEVYSITDEFAADIQTVWGASATSAAKIKQDPIGFLSREAGLDADLLMDASFATVNSVLGKGGAGSIQGDRSSDTRFMDFMAKSEEERAELREAFRKELGFDWLYSKMTPLGDFCVIVIQNYHYLNGDVAYIQEKMELVKAEIKELGKEYEDLECTELLKQLYTSVSAYFDFCLCPNGNYLQAIDTIKDYHNTVKQYISELEFAF